MIVIKRILLIILSIFILISLTSCWDNRDLTEMGIATAIGLDRTNQGDIELTVQIVKPATIKAQSQGSVEESYWTLSSTGHTVFSAIRNLLTTINRKVYFGHVELMVIGEKMAKTGILNALDLFERDHETERTAALIVARASKAKDILTAKSELESIPSMHIKSILDNNIAIAKTVNIDLIDTLKCMNCPGYSPAIGVIIKDGKDNRKNEQSNKKGSQIEIDTGEDLEVKNFKIQGAAIFDKDKLIGWLDTIETRGLLFARDEVQSGIVNTANPLDEEYYVSFEIVRSRGKMDVELNDNSLTLIIEVKAEGRLGDQQGNGDLTTPEMMMKLEDDIAKVIKKNILATMNVAQIKYGADFLGFAPIVHRKYLNYWKKNKDNWKQIFSDANLIVKTEWSTRSTALLKQSSQAR